MVAMAAGGTAAAGMVAAIVEATTAVVGVGADLPQVQSSAGCLQRPTIMGAAPITIMGAVPITTTDLQQAVLWRTACDVSNRMIPVAERI